MARTARAAAVGVCYCRHKMAHVGRACDAPLEICLTFGTTADSLSRHGFARRIDAAEALDLLAEARSRGLVQFGENVRESVAFVCNCCGCCCEALLAQKRFGAFRPVQTTGFLPEVDGGRCNGCGACAKACPVEAMTLRPAGDPRVPGRRAASLVEEACLGCGVCVPSCRRDALRLVRREERVIPPRDTARRVVRMALERGKPRGPRLRRPGPGEPPDPREPPRGDPPASPRRAGPRPRAGEVGLPREGLRGLGAAGGPPRVDAPDRPGALPPRPLRKSRDPLPVPTALLRSARPRQWSPPSPIGKIGTGTTRIPSARVDLRLPLERRVRARRRPVHLRPDLLEALLHALEGRVRGLVSPGLEVVRELVEPLLELALRVGSVREREVVGVLPEQDDLFARRLRVLPDVHGVSDRVVRERQPRHVEAPRRELFRHAVVDDLRAPPHLGRERLAADGVDGRRPRRRGRTPRAPSTRGPRSGSCPSGRARRR